MNDDRASRVRSLIATLDDPDHIEAEEARFALTDDSGSDRLEPLLAAAPSFARFGELMAIEVLHAVGDRRAVPILRRWLSSNDDIVRQNSAELLGELGATEAIDDLRAALAAASARGTPPDWSEPVAMRRALARLGGRSVVIPTEIAPLSADGPWDFAWRLSDLCVVLDGLAAASQVVMCFQIWAFENPGGSTSWYRRPGGRSMSIDWGEPWEQLVAESHRQATSACEALDVNIDAIATVEWIDRADLDPS